MSQHQQQQQQVALCFFISGEHIIYWETIWKYWIQENPDLFNIYIHYKDKSKIKSPWILSHCINEKYIMNTSYYDMIPAYMSTLNYAFRNKSSNKWFCLLTESCAPLLTPTEFKTMFKKYGEYSIMKWTTAKWNIRLHKRANLRFLNPIYHLSHEPWMTLTRRDVFNCIHFISKHNNMYKIICNGGLANESIIAIILKVYGTLHKVINATNSITDWTRMSSSTSPYVFREWNTENKLYIKKQKGLNKFALFFRKVMFQPRDQLDHSSFIIQ